MVIRSQLTNTHSCWFLLSRKSRAGAAGCRSAEAALGSSSGVRLRSGRVGGIDCGEHGWTRPIGSSRRAPPPETQSDDTTGSGRSAPNPAGYRALDSDVRADLERLGPVVERACRAVPPHERQDLYQETMFRLLRHAIARARRVDSSAVDNWEAYAVATARNIWRRWMRAQARLRLTDPIEFERMPDRPSKVARTGRVDRICAASSRIRVEDDPIAHRLLLRVLDGIVTIHGLARATGRPPHRIRSTLRRIARKLAGADGDHGHVPDP